MNSLINGSRIDSPAFSIPVVLSGAGWLILDKPAGLSVHNQPGTDLLSLLNRFFVDHSRAARSIGFSRKFGFHAVHRLDRSTSGLILTACKKEVLSFLAGQFTAHTVTKIYRAVLHGHLPPHAKSGEDGGEWNLPLSPNAAGRKDLQGGGRLLPCRTRYRVLARSTRYSLVELEPLTGRMHQIRRHAALSGHPVAGDKRYGTSRSVKFLKQNLRFDRLALHAYALTLVFPGEVHPATVETGGIPAEMQALFENDIPEETTR